MTHPSTSLEPEVFARFYSAQLNRFSARADTKELSVLAQSLASITPSPLNHGDIGRWTKALDALPAARPSSIELTSARLVIGDAADLHYVLPALEFRAQLESFIPWRKGPFELFGLGIDTEWRCDLKWARF